MERLLLMGISETLNILLVKGEYINRNGWVNLVNNGLAIVSLIYLTITNSVVNPHNIIFLYLEVSIITFLEHRRLP